MADKKKADKKENVAATGAAYPAENVISEKKAKKPSKKEAVKKAPAKKAPAKAPVKKANAKAASQASKKQSKKKGKGLPKAIPYYDPQTGWNSHNDQILYEMACEKVQRLKKQIKNEKNPVMRHRLTDTRDNYELLIEKMLFRDYVSVNNMWNSGMLANPNPEEAARERALALAASRKAGLPEPIMGQSAPEKVSLIEATVGEDENKEIRAYIRKKEKHRIRLKIVPIISLLLFLLYIAAMYAPYYMTGPYASSGLGIVLSLFQLPILSAASSVGDTILGLLDKIGLGGTEVLFYKGIIEGGNFPLSQAALQQGTLFNTIMGYGTLFSLSLAFLIAVLSVIINIIRLFTGAKKVQFLTFLCFLFSVFAGIGLCLTNIIDGDFFGALRRTIGWDVSATNGMGYMMIATVVIPFIAFLFPLFFPVKSKYVDEIEKNKAKLDHKKLAQDAKINAVEKNKERIQQAYQNPQAAAPMRQQGMPQQGARPGMPQQGARPGMPMQYGGAPMQGARPGMSAGQGAKPGMPMQGAKPGMPAQGAPQTNAKGKKSR